MIVSNRKNGRFCNILIRDLILFVIGIKYNYKIEFEINQGSKHVSKEKCELFIKELGLYSLFKDFENKNIHQIKYVTSTNENELLKALQNRRNFDKNTKYNFNKGYMQSKEFIKYLVDYLFGKLENNKLIYNIIKNNKYKYLYRNNTNLFIHIRNGDIFSNPDSILTPRIEYYEKIIKLRKYGVIYISLASKEFANKDDKIKFENLIKKYKNIEIVNESEANTILLGSTSRYVCLSSGTFSLILGLFSYYSKNIYYSNDAGKIFFKDPNKISGWHGNFFQDLNKINKKFIEIKL